MVDWDDRSERDWMEQEVIVEFKNLVICRIGQRDMGKDEKISKKFILPPTPFLYTHTTTRPPHPYENVFIKNFCFLLAFSLKIWYTICVKKLSRRNEKTFYINILKIF